MSALGSSKAKFSYTYAVMQHPKVIFFHGILFVLYPEILTVEWSSATQYISAQYAKYVFHDGARNNEFNLVNLKGICILFLAP